MEDLDYEEEIIFEKVSLNPFDLLSEAGALIKDQYWLFVGVCLVGFLIGTYVPLGILMGPMFCGIYFCFLKKIKTGQMEFGDLFRGFDFFLESFLVTLFLFLLSLLLIVPIYFLIAFGFISTSAFFSVEEGALFAVPWLGFFLLATCGITLLFFIINILFVFAYYLVIDRDQKAIPALTLSAKAVFANFWGVLGMYLVNAVVCLVAALFCYFPIFFVLPLTFGAQSIAYRLIFPDPDDEPQAEETA